VTDITLERKLPNNAEVERTVLAAVLTDSKALAAFDLLTPDDFFTNAHRVIARTMVEMRKAGKPVDTVTLDDEITRLGRTDEAGGAAYVGTLVDGFPEISNFMYYSKILKGDSLLRRLIYESDNIINQAFEASDRPDAILDRALTAISGLRVDAATTEQEGVSFKEAARRLLKRFDEKESELAIRTGIEKLDESTGGFRPGELVVFVGSTGTGKTLLSQQTRRQACQDGHHVLFASGEMDAESLLARELASAAGVPHSKMRKKSAILPDELRRLLQAASHQCDRCAILDGEISLRRIERAARQMKAGKGLELLVIDYDELISVEGRDEFDAQKNLVRGAKSLAIELACPVILVSQLRKLLQGEDRRRPTLARLYGSSAKAKHPHTVIYIERPFVEELCGDETEARICILKNRTGRVGELPCRFNIRTLHFESVPEPSDPSPAIAQDSHPSLPRGDRE
jgi:replicative DNA helicase